MAARGRGCRKDERPAGLRAATVGPPPFHLPLLRLLGNSGGAPFERKRWANQEVRGEPLRRRGWLAHFPFLRALGTFAQQDRGTARASLSRAPVSLNTRRPPQSCWDQGLQLSASAAREKRAISRHRVQVGMGVRRGTGSGGSSVHTPSQASVPAQRTDRRSGSSVQPRRPAKDPGCSLTHPAASTSGRLP